MIKIDFKPVAFNVDKFAIDSYTYRTDNELTREDLSIILDCSANIVNGFEVKGVSPRVDIFYNLCKLMGKEVSDYFG